MIDTTKQISSITYNGVEIPLNNNQATLNTLTISLRNNILTLTNPATNGNFATEFKIFNGTALLATQLIDVTTLDLSTLLMEKGTYTITAKCYGTNMAESAASESVNYVIASYGNYIVFESEDNLAFTLKTYNETANWNGTLEYSTNITSWNTWDGSLINSSNSGKLYLRGTNNTKITGSSNNDYRFVLGGLSTRIQCNGNIENLLDYTTVANGQHPKMAENWCYSCLFSDCKILTTPPELPATSLTNRCYESMFSGCTSLTTAPELPATSLSVSCYNSMFSGCKSLTEPPEMPATVLADYCCWNMFAGCISLTKPPELPATILANQCYRSMFQGCKSLKVSSTQTDVYKYAWRIPTSGTGITATSWNNSMLLGTGGTFTSNPEINTTYYIINQ